MPAEEGISRFRTTQLMITSDFEVYHYREPYFKSLDFHSHDFYEAYLFLDGSVTYYIEEQAYDLCAGNLLVIPPGRMHRPVISNSAAVYERMVLWLNGEYLRQLNPDGELLRQLESFGGERGYLAALSGQELTLSIGVLQRLSALGPEARQGPRRPCGLPHGLGVGDPSPCAPPRQAGRLGPIGHCVVGFCGAA